DLRQAGQLLPEAYTSDQRVRPVKAAALAMLARVQLYLEDWQQAESYATEIIANTSLFELEDIENVFLHNSREAIWQLIPSNRADNNYTFEGNTFIVRNRPSGLVLSSDFVLNDWESGDLRKTTWIGHAEGSFGEAYFPYKYKENSVNASGAEYS